MKLFMVTDYFRPGIGGLENSTAYLGEALQQYLPLEVLTLLPAGSFKEERAIPVRRFSTLDGPPYAAMARYIADHGKDCCVSFFGFSDEWTDSHLDFVELACGSLARRVTLKIPSLNEYPLYVSSEVRRAKLAGVHFFLCPNLAIRDQLRSDGIPAERTIVRPNGVPLHVFMPPAPGRKAELRAALGIRQDPVFLFTGRFAGRKRVDLLAEAFRRVPDAALVLVGYFDDRFDAGSSFDAAGAGNIYVFGPTHDVLPYLQAADVFVSASRAEGMPNSLLEGMSCGLAALVTDISGHREVVRPGENGQFFEPDSVESLVSQIHRMAEDRDRLPELSRAARETVVTRFPIDAVAQTYWALLEGQS